MGLEVKTTTKIYKNNIYLWYRKQRSKVLKFFDKAVWNSRRGLISLVIIGLLLFALGPGSGMSVIREEVAGMSFLQASQTVSVKPGDTVIIPWDMKMDEGDFITGSSAPYQFIASFSYPIGMDNPPDKHLASVTLSPNQTYSGSFEYKVPNVPGTYEVRVNEYLKVRPDQNHWTSSGCFTVTLIATMPAGNNSSNNSSGGNNSSNNSSGGNNSSNNSSGGNNSVTIDDDGNVVLPTQVITGGFTSWLLIGCIIVLVVALYFFWPRKGSVQKIQKRMPTARKITKKSR